MYVYSKTLPQNLGELTSLKRKYIKHKLTTLLSLPSSVSYLNKF